MFNWLKQLFGRGKQQEPDALDKSHAPEIPAEPLPQEINADPTSAQPGSQEEDLAKPAELSTEEEIQTEDPVVQFESPVSAETPVELQTETTIMIQQTPENTVAEPSPETSTEDSSGISTQISTPAGSEETTVVIEAAEEPSDTTEEDPAEDEPTETAVAEDSANDSEAKDTAADPYGLNALNDLMGVPATPDQRKHGKIYAVVNQKGGVGKSTTAVNLSASLAEAGKTVLMIDIDPQGNASSGLGHNRGNGHFDAAAEHGYCIYDVIINSVPIGEVVSRTLQKNLYLLPATIDLAGAEIELVPMMARETRLKSSLEHIRRYFDLIIIDCPPSIGLLTVNALAAADELIIPIQCEYFALEGLSRLVSSIDLVKNSLNPNLTIGGVLMTMQDNRLKLSSEVIDEVRNHFKDKVFEAVIPRNVRLSEAPSHGQPINVYDGASIGAKAYKKLAKEVISRG